MGFLGLIGVNKALTRFDHWSFRDMEMFSPIDFDNQVRQ
jgi:hypothetical protein